jgi:hypothetical protein
LPEHKVGTQKEWQTARDELAKLEAEQAELNEKVKAQRLELPWVPVEKEYELDTEEGKKSLAELFDGRSQLLAYNVMFGPDYTNGRVSRLHQPRGRPRRLARPPEPPRRDADLLLARADRAPHRLQGADGLAVPVRLHLRHRLRVRLRLALTEEQAQQIPEVKEMLDNPPDWLEEWSGQIGAELKDGLRESPSWIAFARENGTVYHTYTVWRPTRSSRPTAASCSSEPRRAPDEPRTWRKDEYPD